MLLFLFLPGALPISPAIYRGSPAPVLFDSPNCDQQTAFQRVIGELPERLIDCNFTNVIGSPLVNRQIITRLVGVQCDSECDHTYLYSKGSFTHTEL